MKISAQKRSFCMVALGVAFEHFDMMLASLLASAIVQEFVGNYSPALQLLYAYAGYAIAFLFRPLGAFCFGCMGDLYGRKTALISSMLLMSTATLGLALIPGVDVLGSAATVLFLMCRIAQGLAVGGEYGAAMTYAYELQPDRRTFYGACVVSSTHLGGLCASLLSGLYAANFRIPFLIGGLVGMCLLLFRSFLHEHYTGSSKNVSELAAESIQDTKGILQAAIVASTLVLVFYGSLLFLNELMHQEMGIPRSQLFRANSLLFGLWIVLPPCIGYIVDRYGLSYFGVMKLGVAGVFLTAPCLGLMLMSHSYPAILGAQILMHIFHMFFCLCTPRFFGDLFAGSARNTAISISYSLGASFTAGLAPMICYISIQVFHTNFAICVPFMLVALLAIFNLNKERIYAKG